MTVYQQAIESLSKINAPINSEVIEGKIKNFLALLTEFDPEEELRFIHDLEDDNSNWNGSGYACYEIFVDLAVVAPPSQRIELFRKYITVVVANRIIEDRRHRWQAPHFSAGETEKARVDSLNYKIHKINNACSKNLKDGVIMPYFVPLILNYVEYQIFEEEIANEFAVAIADARDKDHLRQLTIFWQELMPERSKMILREYDMDTEPGSKSRENIRRALRILGDPITENIEGDKIQVTLGNNNAFYGDFAVATVIRDSFNKASLNTSNELKKLLEDLAISVAKMSEYMAKEDATRVARALNTVVEEASSSKPSREWWQVSIDGLAKAAENIGKVGKPVITILEKLVPILMAMSK